MLSKFYDSSKYLKLNSKTVLKCKLYGERYANKQETVRTCQDDKQQRGKMCKKQNKVLMFTKSQFSTKFLSSVTTIRFINTKIVHLSIQN